MGDFHSIRDDDAQKAAALQTALNQCESKHSVYQRRLGYQTYWNDQYFMINLATKSL